MMHSKDVYNNNDVERILAAKQTNEVLETVLESIDKTKYNGRY